MLKAVFAQFIVDAAWRNTKELRGFGLVATRKLQRRLYEQSLAAIKCLRKATFFVDKDGPHLCSERRILPARSCCGRCSRDRDLVRGRVMSSHSSCLMPETLPHFGRKILETERSAIGFSEDRLQD